MKIITTIVTGLLAANALVAAETSTNNQVLNATTKLREQPNYSWTTKVDLPGMQFTPPPQTGKAEKDGFAMVTQDFNGNDMKVVFKGDKIAVLGEGQWEVINTKDSEDPGNFPAMIGRWLAGSGTPAQEATNLVSKIKELKAVEEGLWSGDLTEKGAGDMLTFGPREANAQVKNAKGSVKFWLKDGALVKIQSHVTGAAPFGPDQEAREIDMTRTIEIQDAGKTKVEIPEEAKKKLEGK